MKSKALLFAVLLCGASILQAQNHKGYDPNHFSGLKAEGAIPADIKKTFSELYNEDQQKARDYKDGKLVNKDQVLFNSYSISQIMANGKILYGDPITRLAERIADTLLADYPQLRKELRFYTVKSPSVNAFATGQGMIFINVGLVAQLQDEAQLAYILAHEIVHYAQKHTLKEITLTKKERDRLTKDTEIDESETESSRVLISTHNRTKAMEGEADSLGLVRYYLPSPYTVDVTEGMFDVLQYGYLPFDEVVFPKDRFNTPYFKLNSSLFLDSVGAITARDDYDDRKSSHPNILKRRGRTLEIIEENTTRKGGRKFLTVTPEEFAQIQLLARFECIRQQLIYADYSEAYYNAFVMEQSHPGNLFLRKAQVHALYGLAKCKTSTNSSKLVPDYQDYEGEIQQVYHLFQNITPAEITMIALRESWKASQQFPEEKEFKTISEELMRSLTKDHSFSRTFFSPTFDTTTVASDTTSANSKYARIKQKKNKVNGFDQRHFVFTDFMEKSSDFDNFMRSCSEPKHEETITPSNILLYAPDYVNFDLSEGVNVNQSEKNLKKFTHDISKMAAGKGHSIIDFSDNAMREFSTEEQYNNFLNLNEWCDEFWQFKGANKQFSKVFFTQDKMNSIIEQNNANVVNINKVLSLTYANSKFTSLRYYFVDAHTGKSIRSLTASEKGNSFPYAESRYYETLSQAIDSTKVPGFAGKHLGITAGVGFSSSHKLKWRSSWDMPTLPRFGWDAHLGLEIPVINREWSLVANFSIKTDSVCWKWVVPEYYDSYYEHTVLYNRATAIVPQRIEQVGIGLRHYLGDAAAPMGPYVGFGAHLAIQHTQFDSITSTNIFSDTALFKPTRLNPGINLSLGANKMLNKWIFINYELYANIALCKRSKAPTEFYGDEWLFEEPQWTPELVKQKECSDFWRGSFIGFKISIGFLPF